MAGAAGAAAAAAGLAAAAAPASTPASATSINATSAPCESESPSFTLISLTTPDTDDGTSMVALSDSSVTRLWSLLTVSPTDTSTSITGTSL